MTNMIASDFWKNFRLGEEVHIAGSFIYNAKRRFHELEHFDYSDELFDFLYSLSVGIERLLKIALVLYEHTDTTDQEALEQSLITHNHLDLLRRLQKHVAVNFGKPQYELLQLLGSFYKTVRYDRFSLNSVYKGDKEASAILALLNKHLNLELVRGNSPFAIANDDRYRAFINRTVSKISQSIFRTIDDRSTKLGLYTYDLRYGSKASSVFLREVNIADEDVLWKELLVFFMNAHPEGGYFSFLKEIEPLKFDPGLIADYLDCFKSDGAKADVMDELEHHYGEMDPEDRKQRLVTMTTIGAQGVYFNEVDLDDDDE